MARLSSIPVGVEIEASYHGLLNRGPRKGQECSIVLFRRLVGGHTLTYWVRWHIASQPDFVTRYSGKRIASMRADLEKAVKLIDPMKADGEVA